MVVHHTETTGMYFTNEDKSESLHHGLILTIITLSSFPDELFVKHERLRNITCTLQDYIMHK